MLIQIVTASLFLSLLLLHKFAIKKNKKASLSNRDRFRSICTSIQLATGSFGGTTVMKTQLSWTLRKGSGTKLRWTLIGGQPTQQSFRCMFQLLAKMVAVDSE